MLFCLHLFVVIEFPGVSSYKKCHTQIFHLSEVCWLQLSSSLCIITYENKGESWIIFKSLVFDVAHFLYVSLYVPQM